MCSGAAAAATAAVAAEIDAGILKLLPLLILYSCAAAIVVAGFAVGGSVVVADAVTL